MKISNSRWRSLRVACLILLLPVHASAAELMITEVTDLTVAYDPGRNELILGALQRLWSVPAVGGEAEPLTPVGLGLSNPAVSPDGRYVAAEGSWVRGQKHLWLVDRQTGNVEQLTRGAWRDESAAWLPDSSGVVFSSNRGGDFHLWMRKLGATVATPLTRGRHSDMDPVIAPGGDIHFIRRTGDRWMLMQRMPDGRQTTLYISQHRLSGPTIRRNGIMTTVQRHQPDGRIVVDALLPRQEMLVKTLTQDAATIEHRPVWLDRDRYVTVNRGRLVIRRPATRGQQSLAFTIWVSIKDPTQTDMVADTTVGTASHTPWVLRGARIYDPRRNTFVDGMDVVIADGQIDAITPRGVTTNTNIIDLGDVVVLPGLIDIDATVTADNAARWLAAGVTSIATLSGQRTDSSLEDTKAPRQINLALRDFRALTDNRDRLKRLADSDGGPFITDQLLPDLTLGQALLDASWFQRNTISSYEDEQLLLNRSGTQVTSHMVERGRLSGRRLDALARSRLWPDAGGPTNLPTSGSPPDSATAYGHLLVAASGNSALPPGLSLIAELLAMHDAGVPMHHVIAAATSRSAAVLGRPDLGRIEAGARADLLILAADPIANPETLLAPIGIVAAGRFSSIPSLLESP